MEENQLESLIEQVTALAESWQNRAVELLKPEEKDVQEQLGRLLARPMDRVFLTKMIDQSFRSRDPGRVADQINSLFGDYGVPNAFQAADKLLMQLFRGFGRHLPELSIPRVIEKMRHDSRHVIISGEKEALTLHLKKRKRQGISLNLNHIGEAVLGEEEARARLEMYLTDLKDPAIEYISLKISTLYSQVNPLAFEHTVEVLKERLMLLFKTARQHPFRQINGYKVPKLVNLDMEEYRDLKITMAAFTQALEDADLIDCTAGMALQAYLPDSFELQQELTDWAKTRLKQGGSPIRIRLVKGANLEMERIDAAMHNWPLAPYDNKLAVDANYKRMVEYGLKPENIRAVRLGVASHNLFDLAYALHLARQNGVESDVTIEMLEGMANHVARAVRETHEKLLLYAPVATGEQFINAIAYLIRRLDENTSPENRCRYSNQTVCQRR